MIKNDRQYHLTKAAAERFRTALDEAKRSSKPSLPELDPRIQDVHRAALASQLQDLEAELREYEELVTKQ